MREVRKERRQNLKSVVAVLFAEVSLEGSLEGMEGPNVTDVRRKGIPLLCKRKKKKTNKKTTAGQMF